MPAAKKTASLIFEPTLAPNLFGEGSPELCWELPGEPFTLALRLTQFGWSAALKCPSGLSEAFQADSLADLSAQVRAASADQAVSKALQTRWILAYESA